MRAPAGSTREELRQMTRLVPPDLIPHWIPGETTLDSGASGWRGLALKGYRYPGQQVDIPEMRDYMIVVYRGAPAVMRRTSGGPWQSERVERGVVSLLTRAERSIWHWDRAIDVRHIYLGHDIIEATAAQVFDRLPERIEIADQLRGADPFLPACAEQLELELAQGGIGHNLVVDALRTQIAVHILRRYARIELPRLTHEGFPAAERDRLIAFIEANLGESFGLDELARCVGLSPWHFARRFKIAFGTTPHGFVTARRIERAKTLLRDRRLPLKAIASDCGFADQSHFCRSFRKHLGVTPQTFRDAG